MCENSKRQTKQARPVTGQQQSQAGSQTGAMGGGEGGGGLQLALVLTERDSPPGDIWQCLEPFLVVTTRGEGGGQGMAP